MNDKFIFIRDLHVPSGSFTQQEKARTNQFGSHRMVVVLLTSIVTTFFFPLFSFSLGFLAHEALIDNAWEKSIQPLLKIKYPKSTDSALQVAHSYSYGGSVIADIGYYPFGSVFFTHLMHYVKTGDFIKSLIHESKDVNEYAFALGVLSHYFADEYGHPLCTNRAVPELFPELKQKFGDYMTFEQAETPHTRVEYGFDVIQTATGGFVPESFHSFIGFQISQPILERAFLKTYKIKLHEIFISLPLAVSFFRYAVNNMLPELTRDAWRIRKSILTKLNPLEGEDKYEYKIDKEAYEKEFGTIPIKATMISFVVGLIPKLGPFEVYKFIEPSLEVQQLFKNTMKTILIHYTKYLKKLALSSPGLENINFDRGKRTVLKEYKLADETNQELLKKQRDK